MKRIPWLVATLTLVAAAPLVAAPGLRDAKPSARQITAARGECSQRRRKVEKLEASAKTDPNLLDKERSAYESACARAEMLMQDAGIEKPSPPPPAQPPPPPTLIIEEGSGRASKPVIIDEPTAPPTTDSRSPLSLAPEKVPEPGAAPPTPPGPYEPAQPPL